MVDDKKKSASQLLSMTGFCSRVLNGQLGAAGKVSLAIEMKAINSRFFEVVCKLPTILNALEVRIINMLQKKLIRGRVYLNVRFAEDNDVLDSMVPSRKALDNYIAAAKFLKENYGISGDLSARDVFSLPNVFVQAKDALQEDEEQLILELINKAADELTKTRLEEGSTLVADFTARFVLCAERIEKIAVLFEQVMLSLKQQIDAKLLEYEQKANDQVKIQLDDLYSTLNKSDIHEEITRFKSHLASVYALLEAQQLEKGKRLDFILQELLRETNTIMAKCSNFDISSFGVDIKVELEKAREQVQNIM